MQVPRLHRSLARSQGTVLPPLHEGEGVNDVATTRKRRPVKGKVQWRNDLKKPVKKLVMKKKRKG